MPTADLEVHEAELDTWLGYLRCRDTSVFHRPEWEDVLGVYGLPYRRLGAFRSGALVGICPLASIRSRLFGNQVVSLPWFDSAGVLADDDAAAGALAAAARQIAVNDRAASVQIRCGTEKALSEFVRTDKVLMRLALGCTSDELWSRFPAKVRNQIRKGQKSGLTLEVGGQELLKDFCVVYERNMRDLGSPSHSRSFFHRICQHFSNECSIYVVRHADLAVGAGFTMQNGDTVEIPWASSLRSYGKACVNHFMYWEILADACRRNAAAFHFGRSSKGSGTYRFKKQWGAEARPLFWYLLPATGSAPDISPVQEQYRWATRVWQKLPVGVARRLGPLFISQIP